MRVSTVLTSAAAVIAASLGIVSVSGSAGAAPDDVVLKGRVVGTSGKPLQGIAVRCDVNTRPGPFVVTGTDAHGRYSFTRKDFDDAVAGEDYSGCDFLWFFDPQGRYITTSWPSGDGTYAGNSVPLPPGEGAEPTVANGTLGRGGQLAGIATDAKKRGLFDVQVEVYSVKTRKVVAKAQTSPYGGYRVLGLRPGKYKVKIGTGVTEIGYRPVYARGGSTFGAARAVTVRAGASTALGRRVVPHTKKLFTSRGTPVLKYKRPLVSGTKVMVSKSGYASTPSTASGSTRFVVASRAVDPITGKANNRLPYAASVWDYEYGDNTQPLVLTSGAYSGVGQGFTFQPFAGRQFVVVAIHSRRGYAQTSAPSAPTVVAR